jgi:3-phosphoshikimate 1-carboxyvinyltransferase
MKQTVHPLSIDAALRAPPSKSVMIRTVAAALLAGEVKTTILNPSRCDDALASLRVAGSLGVTVDTSSRRLVIVGGLSPRMGVLDCGESGLCLRMFTAIAALCDAELTLTGSPALRKRPATFVEGPIEALGGLGRTRDGFPPIVVRGPLEGGRAAVDGAISSQFLTGLLLALPRAPRDSILTVENLTSRPYVELTLMLLDRYGIRVEHDDFREFRIPGGQRYRIGEDRIEGDWSAAACFLVMGAIAGKARVEGLDPHSLQADRRILDVLEAAGAEVERTERGAVVSQGSLCAFDFDASDAPDLVPVLAVLALYAKGTSVFRGVARLRHKECDRTTAVAEELSRLGARIETRGDLVEVTGGPLSGGEVEAHGDHRVAMALATAALGAGGPVTIEGAEHVAKSYPRFFDDLAEAGGAVDL